MCNHYRSSGEWRTLVMSSASSRFRPSPTNCPGPNVQGPDIWPAYTGEILSVEGDRLAAEAATWLLVPVWYRKSFKDWRKTRGGCNNARGETAETSGVFKHAARTGRCLIPGEAFFEYAKERGPDGKKPEHRFSYPHERPFFLAGLRARAEPEEGPMLTYAMVTRPPGPDVCSIGHHREPVVLAPEDLAAWLDPDHPITEFLKPSCADTFKVELARRRA